MGKAAAVTARRSDRALSNEGIGRRLFVEGYGQIGPDYERHLVGGVVADERIVAAGLAAVKIEPVRSPAQLADAVPVLLAVGLARVHGPQAVKPAALIRGVEHAAGAESVCGRTF